MNGIFSSKAQQELRNIALQAKKKILKLQKNLNAIRFGEKHPIKLLDTVTLQIEIEFILGNNIDAIGKSCEKAFDAFLEEGRITTARLVIPDDALVM